MSVWFDHKEVVRINAKVCSLTPAATPPGAIECRLVGARYIKGKGFPYSLPSVGPGAAPGVQAVSLQVTKYSTRR